MTIFHVAGITLNNNVADGNGNFWYVQELEGWDSPTVRSSTIELPNAHGAVTTQGLFGPRDIVVKGLCKAPSTAAYYAAWYGLQSATAGMNRQTTFTFSVEEDVHRFCTVVRSGPVKQRLIGVRAFEFTVVLRADDPYKYLVTPVTGTLAAATPAELNNTGLWPTKRFSVELNGAGTPVITAEGQTWTADGSLPIGTVIDFRNRTVLDGSTSYINNVDIPNSDWLTLDPGNNTVESSVSVDYTFYPAWI